MPLGKATRRILLPKKAAKRAKRKASVKRLIDLYYEEQNKKTDKGRKKGVISPSGTTKCRRYQQFKLLCVPVARVNVRPQMRRIWDNGHSSEARMRHALMKGAEMVGGSFSSKGVNMAIAKLLVAGEADGILTLKHGKWIVDFKTRNRKGFEALLRPSREYIWQAHAYMKGLRIPQYLLYYENKDSQNHKEYTIKFSKKVWAEMMEWAIQPLLDAMRGEYLLERDDHLKGPRKLCQGNECPYFGFCYSDDNLTFGEADNRPTPVRKRHLKVLH